MKTIFEVIDKTGRKIHLSKERWGHIRKKHPEIEDLELIKQVLESANKIKDYELDKSTNYYYKYLKNIKSSAKYLLVIVKYLNGDGFIVTAYFERNIK